MKSSATSLKILALLFVAVILWSFVGCGNSDKSKDSGNKPEAKVFKIGIVYTEPHPVLSTIAEAFKAELLKTYPNTKFVEKHGSGSKAQYPATVRAVLAEEIDLLAPITTPMSIESVKQAAGRVPVVFLAVTDPLGAELVESLENPIHCSGVSDNPPMAGVIDLVLDFYPDTKKIGIPYDPKDQPGVTTARKTAALVTARGLKAELRPVIAESELRAVVRGLAADVDVVVIGMDNLMMKNAGIISRTISEQNVPLFAADDKSVEMGALAGVGVDYADVGKLGSVIAVEVLSGDKDPGKIPVQLLSTGQVFYNTAAASLLNVEIPQTILEVGRAVGQ